ncbi:GPP34 family phosphoprotein [Nocardiopsis eucommiae]|uniref:GPP34 family phosphoprotein n=1 Tax=Nocardiopsis eucommiae TaxID=2831970 RepID=A0A975L9C3_9ACTN|nr:GPP34 family phosphoprotein [Nocardiopsis eucommiae]
MSETPGGHALIAEDVLLMFFQPASGTIAGENVLYYVLGGAVLTELALRDHVTVRGSVVHAGSVAPTDEVLRSAWDYVDRKPHSVHTVIAAIGPRLRATLLDRLVERGHVERDDRRALGFIPRTVLTLGRSGRHEELFERMRSVLVDRTEPTEHVAAVTALVSASGTLPHLDRRIPWNSAVFGRAQELERGDWGAGAAASAVIRANTAVVINAMVVSSVLATR